MNTLLQDNFGIVIIIMLWVLPWKAYALWIASKLNHKRWFLVLIIINTFAILDIIYIFYIAKKTPQDFLKALKTKI